MTAEQTDHSLSRRAQMTDVENETPAHRASSGSYDFDAPAFADLRIKSPQDMSPNTTSWFGTDLFAPRALADPPRALLHMLSLRAAALCIARPGAPRGRSSPPRDLSPRVICVWPRAVLPFLPSRPGVCLDLFSRSLSRTGDKASGLEPLGLSPANGADTPRAEMRTDTRAPPSAQMTPARFESNGGEMESVAPPPPSATRPDSAWERPEPYAETPPARESSNRSKKHSSAKASSAKASAKELSTPIRGRLRTDVSRTPTQPIVDMESLADASLAGESVAGESVADEATDEATVHGMETSEETAQIEIESPPKEIRSHNIEIESPHDERAHQDAIAHQTIDETINATINEITHRVSQV